MNDIEKANEVTDQMIDDILCAAFEGGSTYWADEVKFSGEKPEGCAYASDALTRGGVLLVHDGEQSEWHELDKAKMAEGIKRAAVLFGKTVARFYEDHDAESADVALQFALFNEVIFG